jgi:hypothetical protein
MPGIMVFHSWYSDKPTLRALLWYSATALQHLTRTMAIAGVLRLVAKHHSNAEPINMRLSEYWEL